MNADWLGAALFPIKSSTEKLCRKLCSEMYVEMKHSDWSKNTNVETGDSQSQTT